MNINIPNWRMDHNLRHRFVDWVDNKIQGSRAQADSVCSGCFNFIGYGAGMLGPIRFDYEYGIEEPLGFDTTLAWARWSAFGLMLHVQVEAEGELDLDDDNKLRPMLVYDASYISIGSSKGVYE